MQTRPLDGFLSNLFPDSDEPIHLQALPAKDGPGKPQDIVITRSHLERRIDELREINRTLNLYFRPNSGGGTDDQIRRFNALFIEKDDASFTKQHKALARFHPHIVVETLRSVHAYWLLSSNDLNAGAWRFLQNELIARFKSDKTIANPSRLMRLPYFDYLIYSPINGGTFMRMPIVNVAYDDHFLPVGGMMDYENIFGAELKDINKALLGGIQQRFDPTQEISEGERNASLFRFTRSICRRATDAEIVRVAAREYNEAKLQPPLDTDERDRTIERAIDYGLNEY